MVLNGLSYFCKQDRIIFGYKNILLGAQGCPNLRVWGQNMCFLGINHYFSPSKQITAVRKYLQAKGNI